MYDFPEKVDTLYFNGDLATMTPDRPYGTIRDGALGVSDGRIAWLGARRDLPAGWQRRIGRAEDVRGRWITPGLIDCHTHVVYGGNRSNEFEQRLLGVSYEEIAQLGGGILATVRATREADEAELWQASARRLDSLLRGGVTTVEIKSGYGLDVHTELKMLRVARRLGEVLPVTVVGTFLGAHALPPEYAGRWDDYVDLVCEEMIPRVANEKLATAVDAFCERIAFSREQTERVFRAAREHGLAVKVHAEQLSDQGGAELAARYGALSADHLEYAGDTALEAMRDAGTVAVLLPGAFYFLRETRLPPVERMRHLRVPMAVATDCNPGTSPVGSILTMLNMACTLFRLTPEEALAGVTRNAAQALGLQARKGTLEVGKDADLAVWDIEEPAELAYGLGFNPAVQSVRGDETRSLARNLWGG